ncbi:MAG TPA: MBG domain-containing protein, partial [Opitutaceae bacterium]
FASLAEGALFDIGANQFRISYVGGTGNDVVLTAVVPVTITLSGLAQTYDGEPKPIGVTTTPANIPLSITYNDGATVPTDAGSYAVVVSPADPSYLGSAEGTLVIAKAAASVTLGLLEQTYDGSPKSVTVTTAPAGLPVMLSYNGTATAPTNAGSYAVTAVINHPNYTGSAAGTLGVAKAEAAITLAPLSQPYTGTPREVTATTTPADLVVKLSYDGAEAAPIYPGGHTVVATIEDPNYGGTASGTLQITITALVRHGPTFDGMVDGSVQVLAAENVILNGASTLSGDLLMPGTPTLRLNGSPTVGGVKDGPGNATPTTHTVTINGDAVVRYVVRRVDAIALPGVAAPPKPAGNRSVTLTSSGQSIGDPVTLKNLTLGGGAGEVAVPPGTYGSFTANGGTGFVFGVVGATEPAVYNLQSLTLNGSVALRVVGPVTLTLGGGLTFSGTVGTAGKSEWLTLRLAAGGVTLNTGASLHGEVIAPAGTVSIGSNAAVHGMISADRLQVGTDGLLDDTGL